MNPRWMDSPHKGLPIEHKELCMPLEWYLVKLLGPSLAVPLSCGIFEPASVRQALTRQWKGQQGGTIPGGLDSARSARQAQGGPDASHAGTLRWT